MVMLFRKKILSSCTYCQHATRLSEDQVLCVKKGVVPADKGCRKFVYDPYKRIPLKAKAPDFEKYTDEDFTL